MIADIKIMAVKRLVLLVWDVSWCQDCENREG